MTCRNILFISLLFYSCTGNVGSGSLGGWDNVVFQVPEQKLKKAIDSLYKANPRYRDILKWKSEAEHWVKDHPYLRIVIFYFGDIPEEMYYVTFVDAGTGQNEKYSRLAIRGVENGGGRWKQYDDLSSSEQLRIAKRFDAEIVKTIENILGTKSYKEKKYR